MLENLVVRTDEPDPDDRERYTVVAGGRRLKPMQALVGDVPFLQPIQHLPGDCLALPVRVRGQDQTLGVRQRPGDRAERPGRPRPVSATMAKPSSGFTEPAFTGRSETWPRVAITRYR